MLTVLGKSQAEERVQLPSQARPALARLETALAPPSDDWPVIPTLHAPTLHGLLPDEVETGEEQSVLADLRDRDESPTALTTDGARKLFRRLCEAGDIHVEDDHEYLTPHGARRGAGEAVYRGGDFEAAQRVLRYADPSTTSAMYSHIEAGVRPGGWDVIVRAAPLFRNSCCRWNPVARFALYNFELPLATHHLVCQAPRVGGAGPTQRARFESVNGADILGGATAHASSNTR